MTLASVIAQNDSSEPTSALISFLPIILIFVAMYFLMIRPAQRRARAQRELIQSVEVGDEIITIGGMYGLVRELDDESITVEVSPGTNVRLVRSAVARKLVFDEEYEDESAPDGEATDER
jgi:preprotein translocase subunit YajC